MTPISQFEQELQNTISNINDGIAELNAIREKYEALIDAQSNAMQPLEVATDALNDMTDAFNELKQKHLNTLGKIQEQFTDATKVMCDTLDERTQEMLGKVAEAQNSFELLKETRDDLVAKVTTISSILTDANQKLVQPFENIVSKTITQFDAKSTELHSKIQSSQITLLNQIDERLKILRDVEKTFQDGIKVMEYGVGEMKNLNQAHNIFVKKVDQTLQNLSGKLVTESDKIHKAIATINSRSKITCVLIAVIMIALIVILLRIF